MLVLLGDKERSHEEFAALIAVADLSICTPRCSVSSPPAFELKKVARGVRS
jgi:hypothetical protein